MSADIAVVEATLRLDVASLLMLQIQVKELRDNKCGLTQIKVLTAAGEEP